MGNEPIRNLDSKESGKHMVIVVSGPRPVTLPPLNPDDSSDNIVLSPGENNVDPARWEKYKKHPPILKLLDPKAGVLTEKGIGKASPLGKVYKDMTANELSEIVGRMRDIEQITKIKTLVERKELKAVCNQRINRLIDTVTDDSEVDED